MLTHCFCCFGVSKRLPRAFLNNIFAFNSLKVTLSKPKLNKENLWAVAMQWVGGVGDALRAHRGVRAGMFQTVA